MSEAPVPDSTSGAHGPLEVGIGSPPTPDAPAASRMPSPMERLQREPSRFSLDQAVAVLAPRGDPTLVDFRTVSRLGAPAGEVAVSPKARQALLTPTFGLIGPGGVLPRHYTAWVDAEARQRSTALHGLLDLVGRRFTGLYVKAGAQHRPTLRPAAAETVQAAALGLGTPHLADRLASPLQAMLHHAGALSSQSRSAERLRGMLCEETGSAVRLVEFDGGWMRLPEAERSRLAAPGQPGCHVQLGIDAALGLQVWDASARFLVNLGPLSLASFQALLPGRPQHLRLVELIRLHVGLEQDFAFNPVLAAAEVPPLRLGGPGLGAGQLGWTSWLSSPQPRRRDAGEAILRPSDRNRQTAYGLSGP